MSLETDDEFVTTRGGNGFGFGTRSIVWLSRMSADLSQVHEARRTTLSLYRVKRLPLRGSMETRKVHVFGIREGFRNPDANLPWRLTTRVMNPR